MQIGNFGRRIEVDLRDSLTVKRLLVLPALILALCGCEHMGTHVCKDGACQPSPSAGAAISTRPQN